MAPASSSPRRLRLRPLVFLALLGSGAIPLAISNGVLIWKNRELLMTEERSQLTRAALALSRQLDLELGGVRAQLRQLGVGLLAQPSAATASDRLREPWVAGYIGAFASEHPEIRAVALLDERGDGPRAAASALSAAETAALDEAVEATLAEKRDEFRFFDVHGLGSEPAFALAVRVEPAAGSPDTAAIVVACVARTPLVEDVFRGEARGEVDVFLVGRDGRVLWGGDAVAAAARSLGESDLVRDFARRPLTMTSEYESETATGKRRMIAQVSPVAVAGWGVVVQKPLASAFGSARRLVGGALLATALLAVLSAVLALFAARALGDPIQRLIDSAHEIAAGNFGKRLPEEHAVAELADLSADFNTMSGYVQSYVERLERAARANRDLFVSAIRAFAAAIDAKDPYTRGHSERVAEFSRAIARHLGQGEEFTQKLWIAALLHDVGKIGIDDRVLKKGGVLTPAEFTMMKTHTTIGAEILGPIEPLREMLPAIRWHHENWNGRGYPDGLRGEEIPLTARIVAVADCFDAITTSRPYQRAYAPHVAVETITKLAGARFDAKVVTAFLRAFEAGDIVVRTVEPDPLLAPIGDELPAVVDV